MENGKKMKRPQVDLVEQARQLRLQAEELERKVKLARGTQRIEKPRDLRVLVKPSPSPYYVGDEGPTSQLMDVVATMLTERPWFYRDIVEATGAGENRVKGAITGLQRQRGLHVVDVAPEGTGKALWFIPSDEVLKRLMRVKRATAKR